MALATDLVVNRISGSVLILGAVVMFIGASIPFLTGLGGEAWTGNPEEVLSAVSREPGAWKWANGLIAAAGLLTVIGLAGLTAYLWPDHPVAIAALITFAIAAAMDIASRLLNARVAPWAASQPAEGEGAAVFVGMHELSEGLIQGFILIAFVSMAIYGLAVLQHGTLWLGALLVLFGIGGFILELVGAAIPALIFIGTAVMGIWVITTAGESIP